MANVTKANTPNMRITTMTVSDVDEPFVGFKVVLLDGCLLVNWISVCGEEDEVAFGLSDSWHV